MSHWTKKKSSSGPHMGNCLREQHVSMHCFILFNSQHILQHEVSEYFISIKWLEARSEKISCRLTYIAVRNKPILSLGVWQYVDIYSSVPIRKKNFPQLDMLGQVKYEKTCDQYIKETKKNCQN